MEKAIKDGYKYAVLQAYDSDYSCDLSNLFFAPVRSLFVKISEVDCLGFDSSLWYYQGLSGYILHEEISSVGIRLYYTKSRVQKLVDKKLEERYKRKYHYVDLDEMSDYAG